MKNLSLALHGLALGFSFAFLMLAGVTLFNLFAPYNLTVASISLALYTFSFLYLYFVKARP